MEEPPIKLEYSSAPRWHRRKWFRWAALGLPLLIAAPLFWHWGPEKWERAKLLYWQWRCMSYLPAADEIVYDQDPTGRSPLLNAGGEYIAQAPWLAGPSITAAGRFPKCVGRLAELAMGSGFMGTEAILFMHERISPSGKKYLVIIQGDVLGSDKSIGQLYVDAEVFQPGDWNNFPQPADWMWSFGGRLPPPGFPKRLRIYAGQADPNNASHFSIRYEEDGRTKFVVGYLNDARVDPGRKMPGVDYAQVKLTNRPGM